MLGHVGDLVHELLARQLAVLHLRQLVFPFAGQFGLAQFLHAQAAQQRHQLEGLGRGDQLAALAQHVLLVDQAFDDGRARGRRAQASLAIASRSSSSSTNLPAPSIAPSSVASL